MRKAILVTQKTEDIDPSVIEKARKLFEGGSGEQPGKDAAFSAWLSKLNCKDTLPRGRYFRRKRPSTPLILDEVWQYHTR